MITIKDENELLELSYRLRDRMSEYRFKHTLGVEKAIRKLAKLFLPEQAATLRLAALLHDITKEYSDEMHFEIMREGGVDVEYYKTQSNKIYHSVTAPIIIKKEFPEYADPILLRAIEMHTTGCADMTMADKLLYLADYIEQFRKHDECVRLREYFWGGIEWEEDKEMHLDRCLLISFDYTIKELVDNNSIISERTVEARNALILRIREGEKNGRD